MTTKRRNCCTSIIVLVYGFIQISDAAKCHSVVNECECFPTFDLFNSTSNNSVAICAKISTQSMTWIEADTACKEELSYLISEVTENSSLHIKLQEKDVKIMWIGIRREAGFYIKRHPKPELFQESTKWGFKWEDIELEHDCVALNVTSGLLFTLPCSKPLMFTCQSLDTEPYPEKSIICEDDGNVSVRILPSKDATIPSQLNDCWSVNSAMAFEAGAAVCVKEEELIKLISVVSPWLRTGSRSRLTALYKARCVKIEEVEQEKVPDCTNVFDFDCLHKRRNDRNMKVWISPEISESIPSIDYSKYILKCIVQIDDRVFDSKNDYLRYQWYKNNVPISQQDFLFGINFYADHLKNNFEKTVRQGSYKCEARLSYSQNATSSQEINFLFSDISTYLFIIRGISRQRYRDFSQLEFKSLKKNITNSMSTFLKAVNVYKIMWDFHNISLHENFVSVTLLLYINWTESWNKLGIQNGHEVYRILKNAQEENVRVFQDWGNVSFELQSVGTCFEENVPLTELSRKLTWPDTSHTKNAVSDPLCLNNWKLEKRVCQASFYYGAQWSSFDYSQCTSFQPQIKDFSSQCPVGFKKISKNLCYEIHNEKYDWDTANDVCARTSSRILTIDTLNQTNLYAAMDLRTHYWIEGKDSFKNPLLAEYSKSDFEHELCFKPVRTNGQPTNGSRQEEFDCFSTIGFYNFPTYPCSKKLSFVCIHQPIKLLSSNIFSKTWRKLTNSDTCYLIENEKVHWQEASDLCQKIDKDSYLLRSIQNPEVYSSFKMLLGDHFKHSEDMTSWWINLVHDGDGFKWLNSNRTELEFVDWDSRTDFSAVNSYGLLSLRKLPDKKIRWNLDNRDATHGYICERHNCKDTRPTVAYIEDRTQVTQNSSTENETSLLGILDFRCVPSGWYLTNSVLWFKDGTSVTSDGDNSRLTVPVFPWSIALQGYYWCSVEKEQPLERIVSSKILFRMPGVHTYALSLLSKDKNIWSEWYGFLFSGCEQPTEFLSALAKVLPGSVQNITVKNITYDVHSSKVNTHLHLIYPESAGDEETLLEEIKLAFNSSYKHIDRFYKIFSIAKESIMVRSTVACQRSRTIINATKLTWPSTPIGQTAISEELCIKGDGKAVQRKCLGDFNSGAYWGAVVDQCYERPTNLTVNLYKLSNRKITEDNILDSAKTLSKLTSSPEELEPIDINYIVRVLENIAKIPSTDPQVLHYAVQSVDGKPENHSVFFKKEISSSTSYRITNALESIAMNVNVRGKALEESGDNIAVNILPLNSEDKRIPVGAVFRNWTLSWINLFNGTATQDFENKFNNALTGVILPSSLVVQKMAENTDRTVYMAERSNFLIRKEAYVTQVLRASLGKDPIYDIHPPVRMFFRITQDIKWSNFVSSNCAFWDHRLNRNAGGWSYKGCITRPVTDMNIIHCSCNHLTSFAVILEMKPGNEISEIHKATLSIITYLGCILSIFGLGMIVLTFCVFRKWRKDTKHKALCNLSIALLCFLVIFLVGIERKDSKYRCLAASILLHYFIIASFAWMLVEAIIQYFSLVKVVGTYIPCFIQKAMLFAWGTPLLVVAPVVGINYELYIRRKNFCWLADETFYYAVTLPVLIMLTANFIIFGLILYSTTCGRPKKYLRNNQNDRKEAITRAKAVFCVSLLLGLSWIFGFLAIEDAKLIFQYLFAFTTTLQGFFLFIFFILRQRSARELWINCLLSCAAPEKAHLSYITGSTDAITTRYNKNSIGRTRESKIDKVAFKASLPYISFNEHF
ncbi:uncharacterized protein LOC118195202 isoform X2 [Stegodyphus dumicola]|uniref:uncharacterized protein LOC118195202 isoform X2 n=1 Tax=Stegodyphus dumicola TaxID=202533 RepID=UPI0015B074D1|nr:uncharacterized protein LOC118195202 isoform X2 [Stegodyphus dumicola]